MAEQIVSEGDLITVIMRCTCCNRKYEIKDETKEDCLWQFALNGWYMVESICPHCMKLP